MQGLRGPQRPGGPLYQRPRAGARYPARGGLAEDFWLREGLDALDSRTELRYEPHHTLEDLDSSITKPSFQHFVSMALA